MLYYDPISRSIFRCNHEPEELAEKFYFTMAKGSMTLSEYKAIIGNHYQGPFDDMFGFAFGRITEEEFNAMPFTDMVKQVNVLGEHKGEHITAYSINHLFWPLEEERRLLCGTVTVRTRDAGVPEERILHDIGELVEFMSE